MCIPYKYDILCRCNIIDRFTHNTILKLMYRGADKEDWNIKKKKSNNLMHSTHLAIYRR